jgi:heterodisulfide reductase subunit A2
VSDTVLIIGGGIAGAQAALDLANSGARVVLVERTTSLGGMMAALDKNFPTLDCSICIEAPKLAEIRDHANIEVLTSAEVVGLSGSVGAFQATIRQQPQLVSDDCTRCDLCTKVCPVMQSSEFDAGLASRRAIYSPFPQAVPGRYEIDLQNCLNEPPNYLPCQRCVEVCQPRAIDFGQYLPREHRREVAAVIVATGFDTIDATLLSEFGYGRYPDVLTSREFERLLTAAGPTGGEIVRPSDGAHPESILFVLCVGSRDQRFYKYCFRVCCMYSAKHAFQALDHGVGDVSVMYMDLRAFGKGFDTFVDRTRREGVQYLRGRPAGVEANGSGLRVRYEDTEQGRIQTKDIDMVVLATAVRPPTGLAELATTLGIDLATDGFVRADENRGGTIFTNRPGIYACGAATGPKDIPDSVSEAGAAASLALSHLSHRSWPEPEVVEPVPGLDESRVGVFVCHCGSNIAGTIDIPRVVDFARTLPDVVHAQSQMFSCAGNTQQEIVETVRDKRITRLVVAACSPKTHEATFRRVCHKAGLNPYLLEMVNLRNHDSWVHKEMQEAATEKALDMVRMGVEKARLLTPLETTQQPVIQTALVIGGGIAGMAAATSLARQGYETHLVEKEHALGGLVNHLDELYPARIGAQALVKQLRDEVTAAQVHVHRATEVEHIGGQVGNFTARLTDGQEIQAGAVILATGSRPYQPTEFDYGSDPRVITNLELEGKAAPANAEKVTFVGCVGSRQNGTGCSRYCCESMIGQALKLRRQGKKVRVLYKDIRTFSRDAEELYDEALRGGVQFFRYDAELPPEQAIHYDDGAVTLRDELLGEPVKIPTDLLVLAVGLLPANESLSQQLKVAHSDDGFLLEKHPKLGPAEVASPGIYLAGTVQAPKDTREATAHGRAAAAQASTLLARPTIEKEAITARLDPDKCVVCGLCAPACPYGAIELIGSVKTGSMNFIEAACQGCGACAATCNHDAIEMPYFTKDQILAQIDAALTERAQEKILVFACNWCSYAGADQAGIEKIQYPPSARIIRSMCSGRIEEDFIARAVTRGAGAVLITGCHPGSCHYINANDQTARRFQFWQRKYGRQGMGPDRFQLEWVSASEGKQFAAKIRELDAVVQSRLEVSGVTTR